jgi:membrane protein DedA with SNARE-associated domain
MMFSLSVAEATTVLAQYGYLALFPLVVLEGPIVSVLAGFLASLGIFNFFLLFFVVVAGDVTGDLAHYAIGRWGRKKFIDRWGKYLGLTNERVLQVEKHFEKHQAKTLLLGKISHGIGGIPLVAAGVARMPLGEFFLINLVATLPKSLALLLLGYFFGRAAARINSIFELVAFLLAGSAILFLVGYCFYRSGEKRKQSL